MTPEERTSELPVAPATRSVAVVDDDARVRASVGRLLESAGYRVDLYDSAEALLRVVDATDAVGVVSDVFMPGLDGIALTEQLARTHPRLAVILISGRPQACHESRARDAGAHAYLVKPVDAARLLAVLSAAIERVASVRRPPRAG